MEVPVLGVVIIVGFFVLGTVAVICSYYDIKLREQKDKHEKLKELMAKNLAAYYKQNDRMCQLMVTQSEMVVAMQDDYLRTMKFANELIKRSNVNLEEFSLLEFIDSLKTKKYRDAKKKRVL